MFTITADDAMPNAVARHAETRPDHPFMLEVTGRRQTYAETHTAAAQFAAAFHRLGVRRGDRVLVFTPTCIDTVNIWMGLGRLGAVHVPVNTNFQGDMLTYIINNSRATLMVCAHRWVDRVRDVAPTLNQLNQLVVLDTTSAPENLPFDVTVRREFLSDSLDIDSFRAAQVTLKDPCMLMYTSGTTGPSKGVLLPWGAFVLSSHNLVGGTDAFNAEDIMYLPFPMFHISGTQFSSIVARTGGTVVLRETFSTDEFWSDITTFGCTFSLMVGAMANFLAKRDPTPTDADNPLKTAVIIPMIDGQIDFEKRFGVRSGTLFGMTELGCVLHSGLHHITPQSCGFAQPGYDLRLVDGDDNEVPRGTPGELVARPQIPWTSIIEYFELPEATVASFRNMWFHTGDTFRQTEDGEYLFVDRIKDAIRRRGENISSSDVEYAVLKHDSVLECAAVGVPAEESEDDLKVCVVLKPGRRLDPAELITFLRDTKVPRHMIPRYVELLPTLPKTPTNKIRKDVLRNAGVSATTWDRAALRAVP